MNSSLPPVFSTSLAALVLASIPEAQQYQIIDLTEKAAALGVIQSEARSINAAGQIVGFEALPDFREQAIQWGPDGTASLLPRQPGDDSNSALQIEDDGTILGYSELVTVVPCGHITKFFEDQGATLRRKNVQFDLNAKTTQWPGGGPPDHELRLAWDANRRGKVVGQARPLAGPPFFPRGYMFDRGTVTWLDGLDEPRAINDLGWVAGYSDFGQDHAILWRGGLALDLHTGSPNITGVTSRAWDVNNLGQVVGEAQFLISGPEEPTLWENGVATRLIPEFARPQGIATHVRDDGLILGFYNDLDDLQSGWVGFLIRKGTRVRLDSLIDPSEGWDTLFPWAINESGWIVGGGIRNGVIGRAFLMKPM